MEWNSIAANIMKQKKSYMRFIMEDADDAHLLYFGFPNRIQTYSTVRKWFVKVTEKALLLCSFPTAIVIILFIIEPKDWPVGEKIACCFMPLMVLMPFIWIISFIQGYVLPRRVNKRFDEIIDSAFIGFGKTQLGPGHVQLTKENEEWYLAFYQENNRNMMVIQTVFRSATEDQSYRPTDWNELFRSFCERRGATLKNKSLTRYVGISPNIIRAAFPMRLKLTDSDYRRLYNDLRSFVNTIKQ